MLEGGVQRAGETVRINVQLINARDDAHLWADSYDRKLTAANIFEIQSEIHQRDRRRTQDVAEARRTDTVRGDSDPESTGMAAVPAWQATPCSAQ